MTTMFPHTVTIYNTYTEVGDRFEETIVNNITVLRGVLLDASKAINVSNSGLEGADAVNLYIPFGVEAIDGETGDTKTYIGPIQYWGLEDKAGYWTLSFSGNGGTTFFCKGEVVEPSLSYQAISMKYDGVYNVTKIDEKDFAGSPLQHWEVGGV